MKTVRGLFTEGWVVIPKLGHSFFSVGSTSIALSLLFNPLD